MVVSEMGEQWSPHTEPARQADIQTIPILLPTGKILRTIGMRIPKVPHEVPVAKAIKQAIINIIAGKKLFNAPAWAKVLSTKAFESSKEVVFFRVVAIVRIKIAGTIAIKPLGIQSIASLKVINLRATK